jgi:hypothetical protein
LILGSAVVQGVLAQRADHTSASTGEPLAIELTDYGSLPITGLATEPPRQSR